MTQITVTNPKGRRLKLAETRINIGIGASRGPIGLEIQGDPATWPGKLVQLTGGRKAVAVSGGGADNTLRADLNQPTGAALLTYRLGATGAVSQQQADINDEFVSVTRFGAICDAVIIKDADENIISVTWTTDNRAAIQKAWDYCCSFDPPKTLFYPGLCYVSGKINFNRRTDNQCGFFEVRANGGGGMVTDATGPLIDSSLVAGTEEAPVPGAPAADGLIVNGLYFAHTDPSADAWIISDNILRMQMRKCYGSNIRIHEFSGRFLQSWSIDSSNTFGNHQGWALMALHAYDCDFSYKIEAAPLGRGTYIAIVENVTIGGNGKHLFEGCLGPMVRVEGGHNLLVFDPYSEANQMPDVYLAIEGTIRTVTIVNARLSPTLDNANDPLYWNVILGDVRRLVTIATWASGQLFHDSYVAPEDATEWVPAKPAMIPGEHISIGDITVDPVTGEEIAGSLNTSQRFIELLANGIRKSRANITAHAGGGRTNATPLSDVMNVIYTCASDGDSVILMPAAPAPAYGNGLGIKVRNEGDADLHVWPQEFETIVQNKLLMPYLVIPPGGQVEFTDVVGGQWLATSVY